MVSSAKFHTQWLAQQSSINNDKHSKVPCNGKLSKETIDSVTNYKFSLQAFSFNCRTAFYY
jgi:hypothetical protein